MTGPVPQPGIMDIKPYVGGEAKAGDGPVYKLSSNEGCFGASPKARAALAAAAEDLHLYPDGGANALRAALAELNGVEKDRLVCGAGSDELIAFLCQAYVGVGDNIVQSDHGFLMYSISAKANGGEARFAPEKNLTTDVDAMLAAINDRTRLVFVANPNNPTGSYISRDEVARLRAGLPDGVLLVLDAAYAEFPEDEDYSDGLDLARGADNVAVLRTFSKAYGMGGLRLGWGYFPPAVADVLNRVRGPFNVSTPALAAGLAALEDQDHVRKTLAHTADWRARLTEELESVGLKVPPSTANFILVRFSSEAGRTADDALSFLKERGVLVRQMGAYKLPEYLRVSIGTEEANLALLAALKEFQGR